jgi:hypothetical protein
MDLVVFSGIKGKESNFTYFCTRKDSVDRDRISWVEGSEEMVSPVFS